MIKFHVVMHLVKYFVVRMLLIFGKQYKLDIQNTQKVLKNEKMVIDKEHKENENEYVCEIE